ncbi:dUTP diphosphatase [Bacillus canaveralius]|uniref:dUTP diphosphatase n=1 Tax=Bacillus canaveralius TaxID=1403243 RepID=UPI000F7B7411|nr:dUTP diphosphatase [Bacillus canaveralius]RSK52525.1 dUTPase [Bacillus canaveralius]
MNWQKLFQMQKNLDNHIESEHQLHGTDLFNQKVLALLVEIGELANETRCFKFWSKKGPSPEHVILEEYVDGIHFILSIGIESGFESIEVAQLRTEAGSTLSEQFLKVYKNALHFQKNRSLQDYQQLLENYLQLAGLLGFSGDEIEGAYFAKNEVNYERQRQGY